MPPQYQGEASTLFFLGFLFSVSCIRQGLLRVETTRLHGLVALRLVSAKTGSYVLPRQCCRIPSTTVLKRRLGMTLILKVS